MAAILLFAAWIYAPVRTFAFVTWDDEAYVSRNPDVAAGLTIASIRWALTAMAPYWHPFTWLSHLLDVQLFGLDAGAHHVVSLVWHLANTLLLFGGAAAYEPHDPGVRWPLRASLRPCTRCTSRSVAWIAERKDVLSAFFAFLTIGAYVALRTRALIGPHGARVSVFLREPAREADVRDHAAVAADSGLVAARASSDRSRAGDREAGPADPVDRRVGDRVHRPAARRDGGGSGAATDRGAGVERRDRLWRVPAKDDLARRSGRVVSVSGRAAVSVARRPRLSARSSPSRLSCGSGGGCGTPRPVGCGFSFFSCRSSAVVQVGNQAYADRFTYVPIVGLAMALVWGLADVAHRTPMLRAITSAGLVVIVVILGVVARAQVMTWASSETMWTQVVAVHARQLLRPHVARRGAARSRRRGRRAPPSGARARPSPERP
jgi:hypothetical protein